MIAGPFVCNRNIIVVRDTKYYAHCFFVKNHLNGVQVVHSIFRSLFDPLN